MYIWRPGQLPIGQTAKARSGYRVQSLRKGRDRQCRTHPIHAAPSELVKIALPFYTAGGFDEKRATPNAKMTSLRMMVSLAKTRSGRKRELIHGLGDCLGRDFRLGKRCSLTAGRRSRHGEWPGPKTF
jgi:hypothetical protein